MGRDSRQLLQLLPAFDRTYEGLKRILPGTAGHLGTAFDRTYEGLKLELLGVVGQVGELLLTVPMRV